jgi:hypothetical protein
VQKSPIEIATEKDWASHCGDSYRGICAIGFFASTEVEKGVQAMSAAMAAMGSGASAFKFLYVDAECQQ